MRKNSLGMPKRISAILVSGLFMVMAGLQGCKGAGSDGLESREVQKRPVKVMTVESSQTLETRAFPGIVKAAREIDLAFRVGGPLVEYDLKIGQQVKKGETIARIDPRDFEIRVKKLTAELKAARARLSDAERDFERQKNLLEEDAASRMQYDKTQMALETTQAGIESLMTDLTAAENALEDTRLKAPFDGVVNRKLTENHETVSPGMPVVSLLDVSSIEAATAVPEDVVILSSSFQKIYVSLDAHPGLKIDAELKEIGRQTDNTNQSYPLTAVLDIPEGMTVDPGMAATIHLTVEAGDSRESGIYLPTAAVFSDAAGGSNVWRLDTGTMTTNKVEVETGALKGDRVRILSGISSGDRIVCAGARFLVEGQPVRVLDGNGGDES